MKHPRTLRDWLEQGRSRDVDRHVPCTTVHAGRNEEGAALNIAPERFIVDLRSATPSRQTWRPSSPRSAPGLKLCAGPCARARNRHINGLSAYPGPGRPTDAEAAQSVQSLTGANCTITVAFDARGGLVFKARRSERGLRPEQHGPGPLAGQRHFGAYGPLRGHACGAAQWVGVGAPTPLNRAVREGYCPAPEWA